MEWFYSTSLTQDIMIDDNLSFQKITSLEFVRISEVRQVINFLWLLCGTPKTRYIAQCINILGKSHHDQIHDELKMHLTKGKNRNVVAKPKAKNRASNIYLTEHSTRGEVKEWLESKGFGDRYSGVSLFFCHCFKKSQNMVCFYTELYLPFQLINTRVHKYYISM